MSNSETVNAKIQSLNELSESIRATAVKGTLLLVDLVGSTAYKTKNGEANWLARLRDFQTATAAALYPIKPAKYLGDGILVFFREDAIGPDDCLQKARAVQDSIRTLNISRGYKADHLIQIRQVLNYGEVFLFDGDDPQGSAVDKLFRMEKHVPDNCIGFTNEFKGRLLNGDCCVDAGKFRLKGLASGKHPLFIDNDDTRSFGKNPIAAARRVAAMNDLWDIGRDGSGTIFLVTGNIPPTADHPSLIHAGDKHASLMALRHLSQVGRLDDVRFMESHEVRDEHLQENLVLIGGPYWNQVTRRLMTEVCAPFVFDFSDNNTDETPLLDAETGDNHCGKWSCGRLCHDVGLFARLQNPYNEDRHVILVAGIETSSVQGILEVFSDSQIEFLKLMDHLRRMSAEMGFNDSIHPFFAAVHFEVDFTGKACSPNFSAQTAHIKMNWTPSNHKHTQLAPVE